MWRFPNCWGYPKLSKSMTMTTSIETHGFSEWGSSILGHPPMNVSIIFGSFGSSSNQLSEAYTEKLSSKSVTIQNSRPAWNHKIVFNALLVIKRCFLVPPKPRDFIWFWWIRSQINVRSSSNMRYWEAFTAWSKISAFSGTWFFSLPKVAAYFPRRAHSIQEMKKFDAVEFGTSESSSPWWTPKRWITWNGPQKTWRMLGLTKYMIRHFKTLLIGLFLERELLYVLFFCGNPQVDGKHHNSFLMFALYNVSLELQSSCRLCLVGLPTLDWDGIGSANMLYQRWAEHMATIWKHVGSRICQTESSATVFFFGTSICHVIWNLGKVWYVVVISWTMNEETYHRKKCMGIGSSWTIAVSLADITTDDASKGKASQNDETHFRLVNSAIYLLPTVTFLHVFMCYNTPPHYNCCGWLLTPKSIDIAFWWTFLWWQYCACISSPIIRADNPTNDEHGTLFFVSCWF